MKKSKRIISLMLSLLMIISMLPAGAFSSSAAAASGSCGPTATYTHGIVKQGWSLLAEQVRLLMMYL